MREGFRSRDAGFSLLEFSVMLFLLVLVLGFSIPRFTQLFESTLVHEAAKIAQLLTNLRTQAIIKGEKYRIVMDTAKGNYSVLIESPQTPGSFRKHPRFEKPARLNSPVRFYSVKRTESENEDEERQFSFDGFEFEKIIGETFQFTIDSSGFIDTFDVMLRDDDSYIGLSVVDIMGTVEIGQEREL